MSANTPQSVYRKNYSPPDHWIDRVNLTFQLSERMTRVRAVLAVRSNRDVNPGGRPLVLNGEDIELVGLKLNGTPLVIGEFELKNDSLVIPEVPDDFELETVVEIDPKANTQLSGLYLSDGIFCTQCEAEGFRRITFFLDRPDVMARYSVRIEAEKGRCPVMLSNGNRIESGSMLDGKRFVCWEDPYPKPSYLFALVAGDLACHRGRFTTRSGRDIQLEIWVEEQNTDKCEHALRSLQKAMAWDEERFGLEYDLDIYMIVAVNAFNMGAMENKGLNVFNSKYVLARPETATDGDYEAIEGVIAHEYFHNWTGNRVTCRDWFQLTLKEGLTVFRDQEFSADTTSAAVKRIADVRALRTMQFTEDAGPMAHPIRPEAYVSMDNFYTVTVYEKGAEVVRMYQTLLGREGFRKGMDLYFERHDGSAVECDDFRAAMADANGRDLDQFERWYSQAGTPVVEASGEYDAASRSYRLTLRQSAPRDGDYESRPLHIPISMGLLSSNGRDMPLLMGDGLDTNPPTTRVLELTDAETTFTFKDVAEAPVPSLLRGFSAPIKLEVERGSEELAFLMGQDSDSFRRWDAGFELATRTLLDLAEGQRQGRAMKLDPLFVEAFAEVLDDDGLDGSLKSLALSLPDEIFLGQQMSVIDPDAVHAARVFVVEQLASRLSDRWRAAYDANLDRGTYSASKEAIDRRRIKNRSLAYLVHCHEQATIDLALRQFESAHNMTDRQSALACLTFVDCPEQRSALDKFYELFQEDPLVIDKWFRLQAVAPLADPLGRVVELAQHSEFRLENPNRVYSLIRAFAGGNPVGFHRADGKAYEWVADQVLALDALNPQVASRVVSAFNVWKRYDEKRKSFMQAQLERIASHAKLSKDTSEIVGRALR
ncbi:MAG: aminopeptidase N [Planctomycetes bacterium]|jgi:aminopeptidase N|nr:aminopeptidase N [Planctomycetota bacterium]